MTLTAPGALWLLAVLPLLWWLSQPPRPRHVTWTAHLAQWQAALAALRRRPPRFARLRFLLLAFAVVAAALAAARPVRPGTPGPRRLVAVLDGSASMAAQRVGEASPWQRARAALDAVFATLPPEVEVSLLRAGGPLVRRHGAVARACGDLGAPAGALGVDLAALAAAAAAAPDTVVWTLTDGQGQATLPAVGALTVLAAPGPNATVTAVALDDRWPLPELELQVDVLANVDAPSEVTVRVEGAVLAPAQHTLSLAPGHGERVPFTLQRRPEGGELRVAVALPGDVLATDDVWRAVLPPLPAPRLSLRAADTAGDAAVFAAAAAATLAAEVGGSVVAPDDGAPVGLVLLDGGRSALVPGRVRALTFGTQLGDGEPLPWLRPVVADWDRDGPLTRGLDLSELRLDRAWRGVLPPGEAFLWADDSGERVPLGVVVGSGDVASVHFAFRLQDGNLPLLPALPQLLRRAFVRCYGPGAAPRVTSAAPAAGEQDLRAPARAPDRPLPPFARRDVDLAPWYLLAGLVALALRACVR